MPRRLTASSRIPLLHSLTVTVFLQVASLASLAVLLLLLIAFSLARAELQRTTYSQLQLLATSKENLVESTLLRQRREISVLADSANLLNEQELSTLLGLTGLYNVSTDGVVDSLWGSTEHIADVRTSRMMLGKLSASRVLPQYDDNLLRTYWIVAPRRDGGGSLVAVFDASQLLSVVLESTSTVHVFATSIVYRIGDDLIAIQADDRMQVSPLYLGAYPTLWRAGTPAANAVSGLEGVEQGEDSAGVDVLLAYRSLPSLGVGVVTSVDESVALAPVRRLAATMFGAGLAVIALSTLFLWSLSRRVTSPLKHLQAKLTNLAAKRWNYARDIDTGNEVEIVDAAAFDLTNRLRESYDTLEDKVRDRTKELAAAHAMDSAIFASMEHGLLVVDQHGRITLLNPAAHALTSRDDTAIGASYMDVLSLRDRDGKDLSHEQHPLTVVLTQRTKVLPVPDPGYSLVHGEDARAVQIVASPILQGKRCIGAIAVFRDTTEDRRIEQMKSEFITIASHQLRTPIASIRWYAEMLLGDAGPVSSEQKDYIREISMANQRMIGIVDALLNVSNLEMGTLTAKTNEVVDLLTIMQDVDDTFALEIEQKRLSFIRKGEVGDSLKTCTDSVLFRLIYHNLISNAVKYTPVDGAVQVELRLSHSDKCITIVVHDTGIGIPKSEQKRVFQKLFRAANVKAADTDGTGLGLYICKCAADAINATLTFVSDEGKGTTFTLALPLSTECAEPKRGV